MGYLINSGIKKNTVEQKCSLDNVFVGQGGGGLVRVHAGSAVPVHHVVAAGVVVTAICTGLQRSLGQSVCSPL